MPKVSSSNGAIGCKKEGELPTEPASDITGAEPVKQKAKRTTNPGVRVQGGRIYDSATGTTCHQCRQKTVEVKAKCTECTLWWCPRCLSNRYGEEVEAVAGQAKWPCPRCRGDCNCSNCRKRKGLEATGILANVCKKGGLGSVSELLAKNPNAKRSQLPPAEPKPCQGPKQPKAELKRKAPVIEPSDLVDEDELGARPAPFPDCHDACIRKGSTGAKRMRGVVWPASLPEALSLPEDCNAGDLAEVLEFLKVFGEEAGLQLPDLATFAAELVQPSSKFGRSIFAEDRCSPVGIAHQTFLDLVRKDWGLKGTVGNPGWQDTMRQYLKHDRQQAAASMAALTCLATGSCLEESEEEKQQEPALKADAPQYPEGGYWALPSGTRLRMLWELCLDTLATSLLREKMEEALEEAAAGEKEQREEQAAARKEAREVWQQQRDRQIAALIAGGSTALTIEEQRALMQTARSQTEAAASLAKGKDALGVPPPEMRTLPLGENRDGRLFWNLQSAPALTGKAGAVLVSKSWNSVNSDQWSCLEEPALLVKSLDPRGRREGPLCDQLAAAYGVDCGDILCDTLPSESANQAAQSSIPGPEADSQPAPAVANRMGRAVPKKNASKPKTKASMALGSAAASAAKSRKALQGQEPPARQAAAAAGSAPEGSVKQRRKAGATSVAGSKPSANEQLDSVKDLVGNKARAKSGNARKENVTCSTEAAAATAKPAKRRIVAAVLA